MIRTKRYGIEDASALFGLMKNEGKEWEGYWGAANREKYRAVLENSIVCVAYEDDILCGYCRCRDDGGYGIYVYDLLVDKVYRGRQIGRQLLAQVRADFPEDTLYVMSDVDGYYEKQGFVRIGSVFEACF